MGVGTRGIKTGGGECSWGLGDGGVCGFVFRISISMFMGFVSKLVLLVLPVLIHV